MRGATISISFSRVFSGPIHRDMDTAVPRFLYCYSPRRNCKGEKIRIHMKQIYGRPFVFASNRFAVYTLNGCVENKVTNVVITASVSGNRMTFTFSGDVPNVIKAPVVLYMSTDGTAGSDVLPDRVMYGRLPQNMQGSYSFEPKVCEIFNNGSIRFTMLSPLVMVEFYGQFK